MRVSLVNVHMIEGDAIGECLLTQARFFRQRGDEVRIYALVLPKDASAEAVALTSVVSASNTGAVRDVHFMHSDLYVFHYPGLYPLIEEIKGIDRGAVLFYYHNVTPPELWGSDEELDLLRQSQSAVPRLLPYADMVVTPSDFNADQLTTEYGYDRGRIRVLPMAVAVDRFAPGQPDSRLVGELHLEGRPVVLFVGRMAGNKRIDLLVEALPLIDRQAPGVTLILVGDDASNPAFVENVARVRTRAVALGLADRVIVTGKVDEVAPYYRLADVYASASLHEGFGVPIIEAMASGLPVVASRATAHPQVVGDAGLLAEPDDATDLAAKIVRVMSDAELRRMLVQRGLARAREYSLQQYERGLARIVDEATTGPR